jgi:hypothetical protein
VKIKKRYLLSLAGTVLLAALGVKNPERIVAIGNDVADAVQGHSPKFGD